MITLTYGTLPEMQVFIDQFIKTCDSGLYNTGSDRLTFPELWDKLQAALDGAQDPFFSETGAEHCLYWARDVLWDLGFEWV